MLDALLAVLAVGVGLVLFGVVLGVVPILTARARRRGYGAFGIKAALFPGIVGSVGLIFAFTEADRITGGGSFVMYALIVPVAAWVATTFLIVSILPRKSRFFGPRRTWSLLIPLGWMLCLCAIPIGYFAFVSQSARSDTRLYKVVYLTVMSVVLPAAMGYFMIVRGQEIAHPVTAEAVLARDTRPPVLYIRPFARERDIFVIGPKGKYGQFRRRIRLFDTTRNPHALIPFEEYLAGTVNRLLGPFIALGSPEDDITPTGAARKYARDDDWQQEFERMGRSACAFLVQVGDSNNLKWEFHHIRSQGWSERLFIVTSHSTIPPVTWTDLVDGLKSLGYHLPTDDPGAGAVVTFDLHGVGVVLTTGADLPIQFVEPIAQRIHEVAARTTASASLAPAGDVAGGILSDTSEQAGPDHGSRGGVTTGDVS